MHACRGRDVRRNNPTLQPGLKSINCFPGREKPVGTGAAQDQAQARRPARPADAFRPDVCCLDKLCRSHDRPRRSISQSRNQSLTFQPGRPIERSVWFRHSLRATSFWPQWKPGISDGRRLYSGRHFSHSQGLDFAARPFRTDNRIVKQRCCGIWQGLRP